MEGMGGDDDQSEHSDQDQVDNEGSKEDQRLSEKCYVHKYLV